MVRSGLDIAGCELLHAKIEINLNLGSEKEAVLSDVGYASRESRNEICQCRCLYGMAALIQTKIRKQSNPADHTPQHISCGDRASHILQLGLFTHNCLHQA